VRCPACRSTRVGSGRFCLTCGLDFEETKHPIDPRNRFPPDDTEQLLVAGLAAVIGTALGGLIALVTGIATLVTETSPKIHAINVGFVLQLGVVPFAAVGVGLIAAWAWDAPLRWATRIGSPLQDFREPGQKVTVGLCAVVPVLAALFFILVAPWAVFWTVAGLLGYTLLYLPGKELFRWVWNIVK